jgi:hypothetical protein
MNFYDETHRLTLAVAARGVRDDGGEPPEAPVGRPVVVGCDDGGVPGGGSVAEKDKDEAEAIVRGEVEEPELFYFHREAGTHDPNTGKQYDLARLDRTGSKRSVRRQGRPSQRGPISEGIAKQWDRPGADQRYLERTWLNRWTQADAQAFDVHAWREQRRRWVRSR